MIRGSLLLRGIITKERCIKRLELKQTKTSKKNKTVTFKLGDEAIEILDLISVDRLNNPDSEFYYPSW